MSTTDTKATNPKVTWRNHRGRLANAVLRGDHEAAERARRDMQIALVEDRIRKAVADAPPLPDDVAAQLVELIRTAPSTQEGPAA